MADYVLVHGSWHGGWCWERLSPLLMEQGHRVHAPTLIGLGEQAALATPQIGLSAHVEQIASQLDNDHLKDVVMVGHSYGGMILTGVAELVPDRIGRLVYFDALLPDHNQSCFDLMPGVEAAFQDAADASGAGWLIPPMSAADLGVADSEDAAWVSARLTPMPILTHREKVFAPRRQDRAVRRDYIVCTRFGFGSFAALAAQQGFASVARIDAGHDAQVTHPAELARLLTDAG